MPRIKKRFTDHDHAGALFAEPEEATPDSNAIDSGERPLADRMRPRTLDEFVGQHKIVGKGRALRRMIEGDRLQSLPADR